MTRKEAERINRQEARLLELGFTRDEAEALRRISMTQYCFPGCLPDSDPIGPFPTEEEALEDARSHA